MAPHRPAARLRLRRQHGRPGDALARRALPAAPRRSRLVRRADEPGRALCGLPAAQVRGRAPGEDDRGDRRDAVAGSARLRHPQPDRLGPPDRLLGRPPQIWWSWNDRIVVDQNTQSGALYRDIERLNPHAPVREFVGTWAHTAEMRAPARLPYAISLFGLMPPFRGHASGLILAAPLRSRPRLGPGCVD